MGRKDVGVLERTDSSNQTVVINTQMHEFTSDKPVSTFTYFPPTENTIIHTSSKLNETENMETKHSQFDTKSLQQKHKQN